MGNLLYWAVAFLIIGIVAAGTAVEGARILVWVAVVLFVVSLVGGLLRRGRL